MSNPTIKDLDDKLDKIYLAVVGDEKLSIKGTNQRLEETQQQVDGHHVRITKLESENKKNKWIAFAKGIGVGASGVTAVSATKAGAAIAKIITAAGAAIFLFYLIMLFV